jgi:hypothetical protein
MFCFKNINFKVCADGVFVTNRMAGKADMACIIGGASGRNKGIPPDDCPNVRWCFVMRHLCLGWFRLGTTNGLECDRGRGRGRGRTPGRGERWKSALRTIQVRGRLLSGEAVADRKKKREWNRMGKTGRKLQETKNRFEDLDAFL